MFCVNFHFFIQAYTLMQQLYTANKEKLRKRKEKMSQKRTAYLKQKAKDEAKKNARQRENRKKIFRMLGQAEKRKQRRDRD
jgi:ribosome biogenesis protein BMS1